jgi:hypothetical protein
MRVTRAQVEDPLTEERPVLLESSRVLHNEQWGVYVEGFLRVFDVFPRGPVYIRYTVPLHLCCLPVSMVVFYSFQIPSLSLFFFLSLSLIDLQTDEWKTWAEVAAQAIERHDWRFRIEHLDRCTERGLPQRLLFALRYQRGAREFWDNNNTWNYYLLLRPEVDAPPVQVCRDLD